MLAGGLLAAALTLASCDSKFEDYNTNPNTPTNATPAMLATNCLRSLWPTFTEKKGYMRDEMLCKYISWTEADYHHGMSIDDSYIDAYLNNANVALPSSDEGKIEKIIVQKYLATFMQQPYNAYYEWRRTGWPRMPVNPLSNRNEPTDKMPLRWMYPQDEYDHNSDNVKAAVESQYASSDDWNQTMWLLK